MKKFADLKRRKVNLNVGDAVYFKLRLYHQKTLAQKCCEKLAPRFYSPYQVEEWIGEVAYRLALPLEAKIHNVFHISQLKKVVGEGKIV